MKRLFVFIITIALSNDLNAQDIDLDSLSFNAYYQMLLENYCNDVPSRTPKKPINDISFLKKVDENFFKAIADEQIIIINENHLFPQTRAFNYYLLSSLLTHNNKYHVFFEALNEGDDIINQKQLSDISKEGYYFQEPQMAEILRMVLNRNHSAYAYESLRKEIDFEKYRDLGLSNARNDSFLSKIVSQTTDSSTIVSGMNIRDFNQFLNFYSSYQDIIRKDPQAKFIIVVGHGHVSESIQFCISKDYCWYPFAYVLRYILQENPFTIDITSFLPVCEKKRSAYYDAIFEKVPDRESYYYSSFDDLEKHGSSVKLWETEITNLYIFSPPISMRNNRENWLFFFGRQQYTIPKTVLTNIKKGTAIKAFYSNEDYKQTTPADILHVNSLADNTLLLYPGNYKIVNGATRKILIPSVTIPSPK